MDILRSSIHDALGVTGPLRYETVVEAISSKVAEDERLDWKRELPTDGDEVAKDVAALANTRGGLLIYGVAEDRATGRATAAMPVSLDEGVQRRIRSWLGGRVHPVVGGIDLVPLPGPGNDNEGFLALVVPESPDTPHLVGAPESFRVPYRYGPQTLWMRERDLERSYSERAERRLADEHRLTIILDHLRDQVDLTKGCWMVGAAVPTSPGTFHGPSPTRDDAVATLKAALVRGLSIAQISVARTEVLRSLNSDALNPRVGLRRWVARNTANQTPSDQSDYIHVELHHDGSIGLAVRLNGWYPEPDPPKNYAPIQMIAGFAADFVALVRESQETREAISQTLLRVSLVRSDESPFALLTHESYGGGFVSNSLTQPSWTRDVNRVIPVDAMLSPDEDLDGLKAVAMGIYVDLLSEFGLDHSDRLW